MAAETMADLDPATVIKDDLIALQEDRIAELERENKGLREQLTKK